MRGKFLSLVNIISQITFDTCSAKVCGIGILLAQPMLNADSGTVRKQVAAVFRWHGNIQCWWWRPVVWEFDSTLMVFFTKLMDITI